MNKILFIDTLTTGFDNERCAIYKIGGILCEETATSIKETCRFELNVRPFDKARVDEKALWIGGETRSSMVMYPEQDKAFRVFIEILDKTVNVRDPKDKIYLSAFNSAAFDSAFLKSWFLRNDNKHFRDYFYVQTLDIMSLSAMALLNERQNMQDFHLETTARYMGVIAEHPVKYSCLANADTCMEIYKKVKEKFKIGEDRDYTKVENIVRNF